MSLQWSLEVHQDLERRSSTGGTRFASHLAWVGWVCGIRPWLLSCRKVLRRLWLVNLALRLHRRCNHGRGGCCCHTKLTVWLLALDENHAWTAIPVVRTTSTTAAGDDRNHDATENRKADDNASNSTPSNTTSIRTIDTGIITTLLRRTTIRIQTAVLTVFSTHVVATAKLASRTVGPIGAGLCGVKNTGRKEDQKHKRCHRHH